MAEEDRHLFLRMNDRAGISERRRGPLRALYMKKNRALVDAATKRARFQFLLAETAKQIASASAPSSDFVDIGDFELDVCIPFALFFSDSISGGGNDRRFENEIEQHVALRELALNHFSLVQ
jgi:hypothetical protein